MSKAGGVAAFALILAIVGVGYIFVIQPVFFPPSEQSWSVYNEGYQLSADDYTNISVPGLSITFDNTPQGLIMINFYTYHTVEAGEYIRYAIRLDGVGKYYSPAYYQGD